MKFHLIVGERETSMFCTEISKNVDKHNPPAEDYGLLKNEDAITALNTICYGSMNDGGDITPMVGKPKAFYWCGRFKQICEKAGVPCEVKKI